jgi:predicted nucleic acid-binding Zn ribbon protein
MARLLGRLGGPPSTELMGVVFTRWPEVVGIECADHMKPMRLQGSTLVIGVEQPAWATRARMESGQILDRLRELGDGSIERIEVVVQRP